MVNFTRYNEPIDVRQTIYTTFEEREKKKSNLTEAQKQLGA
jgi:hypothetical protein